MAAGAAVVAGERTVAAGPRVARVASSPDTIRTARRRGLSLLLFLVVLGTQQVMSWLFGGSPFPTDFREPSGRSASSS
jgi:hypothetical protein